jgi:TM2 domain-containing membrane protein YozV
MAEKRPSKLVTFFLSFIPGVGHLYLGAMNRGLQFLIVFFTSLFLYNFLSLMVIPFWLPIVWFYCLFDALQLADQAKLYAEVEDKPLVKWDQIQIRRPWVGWGLIFMGVFLIMDRFLPHILRSYFNNLSWFSRPLLTALVLIGAGIFLLKGKKVSDGD